MYYNAEVARVNAEEHPGPDAVFWDFYDSHPLNCDPIPDADSRMAHWGDLGHYSIQVGNLMQARMLEVELPGGLEDKESFGTKVTPENLETHLEQVREDYRKYLSVSGREDVEWKERVIREAGGS